MNKELIRKITANLPADLLTASCQATGKGITETIIEGLQYIRRTAAAQKAERLRGKLHLDIDIEVSRERTHH